MVVLATVATVIASQAVISGAFSVTRQAVQLGFLPRLTDPAHVDARDRPGLRAGRQLGLFVAVVALVVGFGSSTELASAYGIAVTGTLAIDTMLFFVVVRVAVAQAAVARARRRGGVPRSSSSPSSRANLAKVVHGGWLPLSVALVRLHGADDLAARARDRHRAPGRGGGPAAGVRRRAARP